jgi:hypothetical protein
MPTGQRSAAASPWVIRSVAVRTRDGPERLDQAYRRLIGDAERKQLPPAPGPQPERVDADIALEPRG